MFPVHPRTIKMIEKFNLYKELDKIKNLILSEPIGYIDFLSLICYSKFVITDSGGIQEETSFLNIPCLTLRENTERPITIKHGTNILCGSNEKMIVNEIKKILNGNAKHRRKLKFYDGKTASRIVRVILDKIFKGKN